MEKSRNRVLDNGLAGYVEEAVLSEQQAVLIKTAIAQGKNVLITGSGGNTGKTTLCNVLIDEWSAQHPEGRMLVVEQIREISSTAGNVNLQLEPPGMTAKEWTGVIEAYRPSAISVGELRGGIAAKALFDFWSTKSRAGFATIYAGDPAKALAYFGKMLDEEAGQPVAALLAETIDYVLHLEKSGPGKRVCRAISTIEGYDARTKTFKLAPAV